MMSVARVAAVAIAVCLASWSALAILAGNIGLQRSVAVSSMTLLERPAALALMALVALAVAWAGTRLIAPRPGPIVLVAAVLVGDVVGASVLAPLAIGELELVHAPVVFAAITGLGLQPAAALAGSWVANVAPRRS